MFKTVCRSCHVQPPGAVSDFIAYLDRLRLMGLQALYPLPERQRIMFPQVLYIPDFETRLLGNQIGLAHRHQLAVWKNIVLDEGPVP